MKNILATFGRMFAFDAGPYVIAGFMVADAVWSGWATREIMTLKDRQVVTVQLSRIMGDFVEAEARSGRPAEETRARVATYLKAVETSVQALGRDGRTVLVAEAVVSGGVPDMTDQVRADVVRRMGAGAQSHGSN